mmetsp:Transcript_15159/g.38187  ORF Transcript_15159/g.38187 Transcript_15159/m.38187 type:complete len:104 (-) Transcript_15159:382-693(-)
MTVITVEDPTIPSGEEFKNMGELQRECIRDNYLSDYDRYLDAYSETANSLTKLYGILLRKCDPIMKNKIIVSPDYENSHAKKSVIGLIAIIEGIMRVWRRRTE